MLNELKEFHKVCKLINNHIMFDSLLSSTAWVSRYIFVEKMIRHL